MSDEAKLKAPKEVRCEWRLAVVSDYDEQPQVGSGVYFCPACKSFTANLPAYRYDVCDAKDRRKSAWQDRRGSGYKPTMRNGKLEFVNTRVKP